MACSGATVRVNNGSGKSTFMNVFGARGIPIPDSIDVYQWKREIEPTDLTLRHLREDES